MTSEFTYNDYIEGVTSGKIVTGELIKLAVNRHLSDIKRQNTPEFPYYFDENEGKRWIKFAQLCHHWKGRGHAGTLIRLEPWQQFYFIVLFGWLREPGVRRFRTSYLEIGRKNGKTTIAAVKGLGHLVLDKEPGAQVYFAATKEDQARIGFKDVVEIINATPGLKDVFKVFTKSVVMGNSFIKPLGSDSDTQDGLDPSYAVIDEMHAHPNTGMLNVLESGMASRRSPLIDIITTAGFNRQLPCYSEIRKSSIDTLRGITTNETHLSLIYTLDDKDDWQDENVWIKANPNLGVSVRLDFLKDRCLSAKNEGGSKEVDFKTKNLNLWTDAVSVWIADDDWQACGRHRMEESEFAGRTCWAGLDLASVRDYTSLVLFFPREDGKSDILSYFWIPQDRLNSRIDSDNVNVRQWVKDGWLTETEGNTTDYDWVRGKINELSRLFNIKVLAYDRNNSSQLIIGLTDDGINCAPYAQTANAFNPAIDAIEKMVYDKSLNHMGNPVMRWMCSNVVIQRDSNGNKKFNRKDKSNKIDGMVALGMAVGSWIALPEEIANFEIMMI